MASPNLSEIVTTTLRNRQKSLADNVSNGNALLAKLSDSGRVRTVSGGRTIVEELEYAENATFMYYSGFEVLNVGASDVFTAAEYDWKQAAVNVVASGLETRVQNAGPEQVIDLLASRIRNAERTMKNQISIGVYSDGTGTGGKQITGLLSQVALNPATGTVGGINRAAWQFWRNQTSGDVANLDASADVLELEMRNLWIDCTRGADHTDLIVFDGTLYGLYWGSLTAQQRFTDPKMAQRGFQNVMFNTAPVVLDHDSGIRANTGYFLNTNFISWRPHAQTNFVPLERREPVNQDAIVVPLVFAGNLTLSNASLQGVIYT